MSKKKKKNQAPSRAAGKNPWLDKALRSLPDYLSDSIYCLDASGRFIFVNRSIVERSGISLENLCGSHFLDIIQPEYHRLARKNFERVINGREGAPYELSYQRPDGSVHVIEVHSKPIRHGGKIVGIMGIARNITERKVAEQALKVSEINMAKLVKEKTAAFLVKNKEMAMEIKDLKLENLLLKKRIRKLQVALKS